MDDRIKIWGYPHYGTIVIEYRVPGGVQNTTHPNPGRPFSGTARRAYLPNSKEGLEILMV